MSYKYNNEASIKPLFKDLGRMEEALQRKEANPSVLLSIETVDTKESKLKKMMERINYYIDPEKLAYRGVSKTFIESKLGMNEEVYFERKVAITYQRVVDSAIRRNKEFNLRISDVRNLLKKKKCFYTGTILEEHTDNSFTFDRLDQNKGYVKGNVVACCHWFNQLKNKLVEEPNAPFEGDVKGLLKAFGKAEVK